MVPVIKDADKKGISADFSQEMSELAKKARDGKLSAGRNVGCLLHHLQSLGGIGGRYFTPIINAPEVAILGVCKSHHRAGVGWQGLPAAPDVAAEH
jgi:pyruvate dehydrogenase E2 component (dihydrolipoamide acetyltransferase)